MSPLTGHSAATLNARQAFHAVVRLGFCKLSFRVALEFGAGRSDLLSLPTYLVHVECQYCLASAPTGQI